MRIAVLARVSSHRQEREETIETQLEYARKWAELNHHTIVDIYPDEAVSGLVPLPDRPEGNRLLKDAAARKFEAIAVYRLDRLGRSVLVIHTALATFEQFGIQFISMTEPYDTTTEVGRILVGLLALFAEWERGTIRQRCYDGKLRAASNGTWIGGRSPFGYRVTDKRLVINEETAPVVRDIFLLYVEEGWGMQKIAYKWTAAGLPSPSHIRGEERGNSGRWWASTIRDILTNPLYKGVQTWGKADCPHPVPALVEPVVWEAAQARMNENKQFKTPHHGRRYLLSGLVRCAMPECGVACTGTVWRNGSRAPEGVHYYVCANKLNYTHKGAPRCQGPWLHSSIEAQVLTDCRRLLDDPPLLTQMLREQRAGDFAARDEMLHTRANLIERKAGQRMERERLLTAYRKGRISDEEFDSQDDAIKAEAAFIDSEVARLDLRLANLEGEGRALDKVEGLLAALRQQELSDAEMVRILVRDIQLDWGPDGKPRAIVSYWPEENSAVNTLTTRSPIDTVWLRRAYAA